MSAHGKAPRRSKGGHVPEIRTPVVVSTELQQLAHWRETMKRLVLFISAVCVVALPLAASAGDYHVGATLPCYDCHTMHYS